ncbi:hypothetical protein IID04_01230 [PVC group bacterium]|nr:hypothetical protein [PVC group bacterium]
MPNEASQEEFLRHPEAILPGPPHSGWALSFIEDFQKIKPHYNDAMGLYQENLSI